MNKQRGFFILMSLTGMAAVFLPWQQFPATGLETSTTTNGFREFGIVTYLAFMAVAIVALTSGKRNMPLEKTMRLMVVSSAMIALTGICITMANQPAIEDNTGLIRRAGIGVWIASGAATAIILAGLLSRNKNILSLKHKPLISQQVNLIDKHRDEPVSNAFNDLEKLMDLKYKGIITEEEYSRLKQRLL